MGEDAISPGECWLVLDMFGRLIETPSSASVWIPIAGVVLLRGILIFALIRLRDPKAVPLRCPRHLRHTPPDRPRLPPSSHVELRVVVAFR
jgi:hypothetical protein